VAIEQVAEVVIRRHVEIAAAKGLVRHAPAGRPPAPGHLDRAQHLGGVPLWQLWYSRVPVRSSHTARQHHHHRTRASQEALATLEHTEYRPVASVLRGRAEGIPWVRFRKEDRKAEVMAPYLKRAAAAGRSQVVAIGLAQEFQRVWAACQRETKTAAPQFTFAKADRRVTCYYFYLRDAGFGPAFIKVCSYFPYPAKIWVNGHQWAKRQAARAGIGFTGLSNGFAACDDPAALQEICDRLQPGTIEVFAQRWLHRLPMPLTDYDEACG
jgi:hypothetical protein